MKIINQTKGIVLAESAELAESFFSRLKGLLGRSGLANGEALIIKRCNSIHTLFMRFPIDVMFVGKDNRVVKTLSKVKPFRLSGVYFGACLAIELPSGVIVASQTKEFDLLNFETV